MIANYVERSIKFRLRSITIATYALVLFGLNFSSDLHAVRNRYYDDENATIIKEMRDSLDDIRHEVNNHESEIRVYDEKLKNLESIIDGVRDQITESSQAHKEQLKGNSSNLETKIASVDTTIKGLIADLRLFKTHANDASVAITQYKQKISELEKIVEQQNQNIDHLQTAMRSLMEALVVKESPPAKPNQVSSSSNVASADQLATGLYRVKAGDNLEKIARNNQTTVSVIRELNGLNTDRLAIGQVLKMPEK